MGIFLKSNHSGVNVGNIIIPFNLPKPLLWFLAPFVAAAILLSVWPEMRIRTAEAILGPKPVITDTTPVAPNTKPVPSTAPLAPTPSPPKAPEKEKEEIKITEAPRTPPKVTQPAPALPGFRSVPDLQWKLWRFLHYGQLYSDFPSAMRALKKANVAISLGAQKKLRDRMLSTISKDKASTIVRVTVGELGFSGTATLSQIVHRAKARGLDLFPINAIPAAAINFSEDNNLFFATQLTDKEYPWRAVLLLSPSPEDNIDTVITLKEWDGFWERNTERDQPFGSLAAFLFTLP